MLFAYLDGIAQWDIQTFDCVGALYKCPDCDKLHEIEPRIRVLAIRWKTNGKVVTTGFAMN